MVEKELHGDPMFKDFFDFVIMDKKWFYLSQKSEKYYLLPKEDEPHRTCKNKNYIPRIMFLCVCARPRFKNGECIFMGKLVVFPWSLMNRLKEVMGEPVVSVVTL
jgi:hypothetical protein